MTTNEAWTALKENRHNLDAKIVVDLAAQRRGGEILESYRDWWSTRCMRAEATESDVREQEARERFLDDAFSQEEGAKSCGS